LLVLLLNLLAAGATSFPGVFNTAWILLPVALANSETPVWTWQPKRIPALALVLASLALVFLCSRTLVSPVLESAALLARADEALATRQPSEAQATLLAAASADPWSPIPWHRLADLRFQHWLATQSDTDWHDFQSAADEFARREPHHEIQFTAQGNWLLAAWRRSNDPAHLAAAIDAYRQAVAWYPERALMHAQLAWALHLAGRADEAAAAADRAIELDAKNPHAEQKLSRQTVYDPSLETTTAEQIVRRLRTSTGPETLP
jgi:tetratricopeptide (TPR) repeat protein